MSALGRESQPTERGFSISPWTTLRQDFDKLSLKAQSVGSVY